MRDENPPVLPPWRQRRWQLWALLAAALLLWVVLRPGGASAGRAVSTAARPVGGVVASTVARTAAPPLAPLPESIVRAGLSPAEGNPFVPLAAPEPPPEPVVVAPAPPVDMPPAIAPLNAEFSGRMTAPDGAVKVYARVGGEEVLLAPGVQLPSGHAVAAITADAVEFSHPAMAERQRMALPPPPAHELR
ncbi:MAG: hypothetical protein QM617_00605 [Comamonas sp.]